MTSMVEDSGTSQERNGERIAESKSLSPQGGTSSSSRKRRKVNHGEHLVTFDLSPRLMASSLLMVFMQRQLVYIVGDR